MPNLRAKIDKYVCEPYGHIITQQIFWPREDDNICHCGGKLNVNSKEKNMILLDAGNFPKFTVDKIRLPLSGIHIGQMFKIEAQVKIDMINAEGPSYTLEVQAIEFPGMNEGTMEERKEQRNQKAQPPTKIKRTG